MPEPQKRREAGTPRDAILFPANFKTLFVCFVIKLLDILPMLSKQNFPYCRSFHFVPCSMIPGWAVISVQYKNKATAAH
jgi:hypothetical protein